MLELPKVQTQKQFMEALYDGISPPRTPSNDDKSAAGRPPDLKTYLIENNSEMCQEFHTENLQINIDQTGLKHIKILTLTDKKEENKRLQFYLDKTDTRFLVLHTFDLAKNVSPMIDRLINSNKIELDNAWLSTGMLKTISRGFGNTEHGYYVSHTDYFQHEAKDDEPIKPDTYSRIHISGNQSEKILQLLENDADVARMLSYNKVVIGRGTKNNGVVEDLYYSGRFSVVKGESIGDHVSLIEMVKKHYVDQIRTIEEHEIYGNCNTKSVEGKPFDFCFKRKVDDWDHFLDQIVSPKNPFRILGIKNKIDNEFYQVLGIDIHTGHPFDIEVTNDFFRVYLPKGSCGNLVARLFVNLQRFFDSKISCPDII